jgi:tartrate-resistant acid phosphatase type 5
VTAQIAYTKLSSRWTYDDYWFTKSLTVDGVTTQVVMIDTVTIAGIAYKDDATGEIHSNEPHPMQANWTSQLQWLEETLKSSTADYLWVVGHYPVYSQCEHGPTHKIIREVLPLMSKYKASGYIAGHDHCSGYYFDDNMAFVIAGAGKQCCYEPKNLNNRANPGLPLFRMDAGKNEGDGGGFASYTVSATGTQILTRLGDCVVFALAFARASRPSRASAEPGHARHAHAMPASSRDRGWRPTRSSCYRPERSNPPHVRTKQSPKTSTLNV